MHSSYSRALRLALLGIILLVGRAVFLPLHDIAQVFSSEQNIIALHDIQFAVYGRDELTFDLARPATASGPFPVMVFIHGGGWRRDGDAFRQEIFEAARHGYAGVRISYRLLAAHDGQTCNTFPAQLDDVEAALRFLSEHAATYRLDPQRVALVGASAGGHLALLAGFAHDDTRGAKCDVRAIVNFYGPTDLVHAYRHHPESRTLLRLLLGGTLDRVPRLYERASPVNYVTRDCPPVLTIHGGRDVIVPLDQARLLDERMRLLGAHHELVVMSNDEHGLSEHTWVKARQLMYGFVGRYLDTPASAAATNHKRATPAKQVHL